MAFESTRIPPPLDTMSQTMLTQMPFHFACYTGDGHKLDTLIGRALLENDNNAVAMEACMAVLVSEEDTLNGWTPAHWAAYYGQLGCLMKLNVRPHLGFDTPSQRSNISPLHLSAKSGAVLCLKWLLQCGASKNRQDFMGETPLHKAAKMGNTHCASMLVGHGASLSLKNSRGLSPADTAEQSNHIALAQYLRRAAEQAEWGSVTTCNSTTPAFALSELNVGRLNGDVEENGNSVILMNGERIHNSRKNDNHLQMEAEGDIEMDEGAHQNDSSRSDNNPPANVNHSRFKTFGTKRSIDDLDDDEQFYKKQCTDPFRQSQHFTQIAPRQSPEPMPQSSLMEHHASVLAQQGYDSSFMSTMTNAFH